ncbi:PucR family transcriptional regulator ligand-binding domain-containing protein [Streptomyces diacarni]|uniref:PucR family transcriptional regulator n=1 Tax=Streptomyces diacarni TaxID=2800381 RepID=UPI003401B0CD
MPLSVRDVLALEPLRAGFPQVIAGAEHLSRPVRWVHVSQLTDLTGLLRGGELVLTTAEGPAGARDEPGLAAYLARLDAAGAAGVVIEAVGAAGGHLAGSSERPESGAGPSPGGGSGADGDGGGGGDGEDRAAALARAAEGLRFPVILLRHGVRFVDVTEAVHSQIVNEHYEELKFAQRTHEAFTTLSLEHAALETVVGRAAALSGTAVVFEDVAHRVLASTPGPGGSTVDLLTGWERRSRLVPELDRTGIGGGEDWLHTPVVVHQRVWGRLVMPDARGTDGGRAPRVRMVLERAAQALSLRLMAEQDQADVERRAQGGLLNDLAEGRVPGEPEALARAEAVGLRPGARYLPLALRFAHPPAADPLDVQRRDRRHLEAVIRAAKAAGISALVTANHTGEIRVLFSCAAPTQEDRLLERFAGLLDQQLPGSGQHGDGQHRRIGVGHGASSLVAAARRLPEAAHIAEVAAGMDGAERPFHRSADLRLRGLLSLLRDNRHLQAFAETELYRILEDEARNGPGLLGLLRDYLAVNGNKNALARRTRLSRPTLYTRIAAIERLLGVDLEDPESRACLYVALLTRDLVAPHTRTP